MSNTWHTLRLLISASTLTVLAVNSTAHVRHRVDARGSNRAMSVPIRVHHMTAGAALHINRPTVWRAGIIHELSAPVVVEAGGTLVIEAGTRIEAGPGTSVEVSREGRLVALGTALQPIVLTCTSATKYEGCWGGLTVKGWAPLNFGALTSPAARGIGAAGCRQSETGSSGYGGCDAADSSGALRYLRIEYASHGLQLLGVGAKTAIDFIQINRSEGDGLTVSGGTVDIRHMLLTANRGYGLSWRSGWRGRGQYISVQQDERGNAGGISGSNEGASVSAITGEPRSAPMLFNVTIISPLLGSAPATAPAAVHLRRGTSAVLRNVLIHSAASALDLDDSRTCLETSGTPRPVLTNAVVANTPSLGSPDDDPLSCEPYVSPNAEAEWIADGANAVGVITDVVVANALIRNALNLSIPDLRPASGGAAVTNPVALPPSDGFFDVASAFIGAVPSNVATRNEIPWYSGWTTPAPVPPLPGSVNGIVASATRGPIENAVVRATPTREALTSVTGSYSFGLPAGDHLLTATALPVGCGAPPRSIVLTSGGTTVTDFAVDCNTIASMSMGSFHGCGLSSAGVAQCWGGNEYGMVGDGTTVSPLTTPVFVAGGHTFLAGSLSSGYTHTCGIRGTRAACWGLNFFAALGVGSTGLFAVQPVEVGNSSTPSFVRVSAGGYHGCGLTAAGAAWCWGWSQEGQSGQPGVAPQLTPVLVPAGPLVFTQITAGESHTCALTAAGEAWCWGGNGRGELGSDPAVIGAQSNTPVPVPGGLTFASIDAGTVHTCGITTGAQLYCWGSQEYGQLGNGIVGGASVGPVPVSGGATYAQVAAGGQTTCAVTATMIAQCWGSGASGVLGNGTTPTAQAVPVPVSGGLSVRGVVVNLSDVAGASACAHTLLGDAYCWGAGTAGQLGNGALLPSTTPLQVLVRGPF